MLRAIQKFFDSHIGSRVGDDNKATAERGLRVATAALLVEVSRADYTVQDVERDAIVEAVQKMFDLDMQETDEIIALAEDEVKTSTSLYEFTKLIDKSFSTEQKSRVIELLWRVVFADDQKDKHEEHLVRKIADLLHISHSEFIRTRHLVETSIAAS